MTQAQTTHDLLVIGGGINGAGIAADAAGRGLNVLLCEKSDLAAATSSRSTKLIHGGLRYLEHYEFGLVRKSLKEREILAVAAAHLIKPIPFHIPQTTHSRHSIMLRVGLPESPGCQVRAIRGGQGVKISMDAKERRVDNVFVERLWRRHGIHPTMNITQSGDRRLWALSGVSDS